MESNLSQIDYRWTASQYYLKRQVMKLIGGAFFIYGPGERLCFYVHQKGFKLKEDITVYGDEAKTQPLITIRARQIMDFSAAYDVVDNATGQKVGVFRRKGLRSIARDEWDVCDASDQPYGKLIEDTLLVALLRRLLSNLIPQNYDIFIGEERVADLAQNFNPFTYHLKMDFSMDRVGKLDRRMGIAASVLMAAIEGRQG